MLVAHLFSFKIIFFLGEREVFGLSPKIEKPQGQKTSGAHLYRALRVLTKINLLEKSSC